MKAAWKGEMRDMDFESIKQNKDAAQFFRMVKEQIRYKAVQDTACKELEEHLEDKAEAFVKAGMKEEKAVYQAVKEMGDPTAIGVLLNQSYRLQTDYKLLGLILLAVIGGVISNLVYGYDIFYSSYFFLGIVVLFLVMIYGYRFCVVYTNFFIVAVLALVIFFCGYGVVQNMLPQNLPFRPMSITTVYGCLLLLIPLYAVLLYKGQHKKAMGILAPLFVVGSVLAACIGMPIIEYLLPAIVTVILSLLAVSAAAYGRRKVLCIPFIAGAVLLGLLCGLFGNQMEKSIQLFFTPKAQATSRWEDGYNGVLIKELLGKAEVFGEISLTEEELTAYGSGDWYFKNGEDADFMKPFYLRSDKPQTEDILPQHYLNNYRIAYVILKYGWAVGIVFLGGLAALAGMLFYTTFRIKNKLGFLLAIGSSTALSAQTVLYVLGNFGHQLGMFPNLPFSSEGAVSSVVNMTLAGIVLSAYRYDRVIHEEQLVREKRKIS